MFLKTLCHHHMILAWSLNFFILKCSLCPLKNKKMIFIFFCCLQPLTLPAIMAGHYVYEYNTSKDLISTTNSGLWCRLFSPLLLLLRHSAVRIIMGWYKMHNWGESSSCKNPSSKGNRLISTAYVDLLRYKDLWLIIGVLSTTCKTSSTRVFD